MTDPTPPPAHDPKTCVCCQRKRPWSLGKGIAESITALAWMVGLSVLFITMSAKDLAPFLRAWRCLP